jgi:hypothetical protein
MKLLQLFNRTTTVKVDDEDYNNLILHNWYCLETARQLIIQNELGEHLTRFLIKTEYPCVDHINGDRTDYQKHNLRSATRSQNAANKRKRAGCSSKYKGVYWYSKSSKWKAQIEVNQHNKHLGYFIHEEDAAKAYDSAAIFYFGEFARLNFPMKVMKI